MRYVEAAVQCEFEKMAKHAVDSFVGTVDNRSWNDTYADQLFKKQVKHFFELYWVVSGGSHETYQDWYAQTGARLASTKNCRAFYQVNESGRKCSLCGDREIFHNGRGEPMKWWQRFSQRRAKYCRQDEALCTVCLTKRLAGEYFGKRHPEIKNLAFPSTSEVSTADFKFQITKNDDAKEKYQKFVTSVRTLKDTNSKQLEVNIDPVRKLQVSLGNWNIDGDWLFDGAFSKDNLERYYNIGEKAQIKQKQEISKCEELRQGLVKQIAPSRYFAVIVLDGDGMGQTISQAKNSEAHADISGKLNGYTAKSTTNRR